MFPIKMTYQPTETSLSVKADVYAINTVPTISGEEIGIDTVAVAWLAQNKTWITAPLWCFTPNEVLKETL